jgi:hypothetical protein
LLKAQEGDEVRVIAPGGVQVLEVTGIRYESLEPNGLNDSSDDELSD